MTRGKEMLTVMLCFFMTDALGGDDDGEREMQMMQLSQSRYEREREVTFIESSVISSSCLAHKNRVRTSLCKLERRTVLSRSLRMVHCLSSFSSLLMI